MKKVIASYVSTLLYKTSWVYGKVVTVRRLSIMLILPMVISSCTTAITLGESNNKSKIYSGTVRQVDLGCAHGTCLDFPFSFVADTVLLPVTIPWTLVNFARGDKNSAKNKPEPFLAAEKNK